MDKLAPSPLGRVSRTLTPTSPDTDLPGAVPTLWNPCPSQPSPSETDLILQEPVSMSPSLRVKCPLSLRGALAPVPVGWQPQGPPVTDWRTVCHYLLVSRPRAPKAGPASSVCNLGVQLAPGTQGLLVRAPTERGGAVTLLTLKTDFLLL